MSPICHQLRHRNVNPSMRALRGPCTRGIAVPGWLSTSMHIVLLFCTIKADIMHFGNPPSLTARHGTCETCDLWCLHTAAAHCHSRNRSHDITLDKGSGFARALRPSQMITLQITGAVAGQAIQRTSISTPLVDILPPNSPTKASQFLQHRYPPADGTIACHDTRPATTMADSNTIHSLTSTLSSQPMSTPGGSEQHVQHPQHTPHLAAPGELQNHPGMPMGMGPPPPPAQPQQLDGANPEQPVKRRPGRPKGSGKKPVDPNAPPKIKRPVGRPRKDGLPAGSVGPRRPSRPRKRPPGTYASGPQSSPPASLGYGSQFIADPAWASASAPPLGIRGGRPPVFPIDPSLEQDDWADMARNRPDRFLHALVAALEAPNPVSGAGPSVEEAFKSHLVSLAPNSKNAPSIPSLYSILKTFWLPSSPVYFSLTASASTARTPSEHRFLYWDPQPLVFNGICCPACAAPLTNRGRISSGPIKVYDLGKPFFVIGCEYVCTSPVCLGATAQQGRKFASTDASILRALPLKLKDEFPALLLQGNPDLGSGPEIWSWHGMGVSTTLWNMVRASLRAGLRKEAILDIIRATQLGVSDYDYPAFKREEEDHVRGSIGAPGADDEDDQESHDVQQVEGDLADPKDKSAEEYQEAWNANSGVPEANGVNGAPHLSPEQHHQPPQAGPSSASPHEQSDSSQQSQGHPSQSQHSPNQSQTQNQSASAGPPPPGQVPPPYYAYPQGPYQPYPYPAYWHQPPPPPPPPHASTPAPGHEPGPGGSLKRTFSIVDGTPEPGMSEPLQKRIRHCCKCGSNECKGKGGRAFCNNPCQDCGKLECKGRNSKRPDRTCADAWP